MDNDISIVANPIVVNEDLDNDRNSGTRENEATSDQNDPSPQLLPPSPHPDPREDESSRETLASDVATPLADNQKPKPKFNNKGQHRHWNFTFNNYTQANYDQIKSALQSDESSPLKSRKSVSAIVALEVGESGTPHLQACVHFKVVKRQEGVFKFFGYFTPRFHLFPHDLKRKPPLAAFRYCMKDNDFYVVGKNLDDIARLKEKTKEATGNEGGECTELTSKIEKCEVTSMAQARAYCAEIVARHEEYWRGLIVEHMPKPTPKDHALRPWQRMLDEKLNEPFSDREVIFVVDIKGSSGKSWFVEQYKFLKGKCCYGIGADKREHISYQITNKVIEGGSPDVMFMDAPRARAQHVSYPFLEEVKDGKINTPKYKSKTVYLTKRPHVVVMMNEFPQKNLNEKGLSEDRYTYLVIDDNGEDAEWFQGFRDPSSFHQPTAYEIVQSTIQSRLPNNLQDNLNRALNPASVRQNKKQVQKPSAKLSPMQFKRGQNLPSNAYA